MSEENVWTEEQIKEAAQKIDGLIVGEGMVELFDGPAAKVALNFTNTMLGKYAPKWSWGIFKAGMVSFLKWEAPRPS